MNSLWKRMRSCQWAGLLAALLGMAVSIGGCDRQTPDQADVATSRPKTRPGYIAFIGAGERDALWPVLEKGARQYDQELCTLEVRYICPQGDSAQDQIEVLKTLDPQGLQGLCIEVVDIAAAEQALRPFYDRGVRIVSMIKPLPEEMRVGHVGFDETEVGRLLAEAVGQVVPQDGTIMLLHAGSDHPVYGPRRASFQREMKNYRWVETILSVDCHWNVRQARAAMKEHSVRYPRLSAWVALDDWPLRGAGLEPGIMPSGCKLITFGGWPEQWSDMREGLCPVVVAGDYGQLGRQALQACELSIIDISRFKHDFRAPLRLVTGDDLGAYINEWRRWGYQPTTRPTP